MEQENIIKVPSTKRLSDPKPTLTGTRAMRVNELVETERKFVQDLEALQVKFHFIPNGSPPANIFDMVNQPVFPLSFCPLLQIM